MPRYWIEPLADDQDLEGVIEVEAESFTNPWTHAMYAWELQNRSVCHILVARNEECRVAGFCAFWLAFDEMHINNMALRPRFRGAGHRHGASAPRDRGREGPWGKAGHARGQGVERPGTEIVRTAGVLCRRYAPELLHESSGGRSNPVERRRGCGVVAPLDPEPGPGGRLVPARIECVKVRSG